MKKTLFAFGVLVLSSSTFAADDRFSPPLTPMARRLIQDTADLLGSCDTYRLSSGELAYSCTKADGSFGGTYSTAGECANACQ